jgi:hypothetical protein
MPRGGTIRAWASPSAPGSIPPPTPSDCKALRRISPPSPIAWAIAFQANGAISTGACSTPRRPCFARYLSHRNVTLIHGDAHVWNVLMPKDEQSGDVRLFDWDTWRIGLPSSDLAYMMAMHWYPELRRYRERPLLDRYHAALLAQGVGGYDRRALDDDYRLSVLLQILTPVLQAAYDIPPWIWWNNLERILLAVDDLGCRELLG